jgi:hypothetical protein
MKTCSRCREEKSLSEFAPCKHTKDGYFAYCIKCTKEYQWEWRKNNKEKLARLRKNEKYKKYDKEYNAKWMRANPEKAIARRRVESALKSGVLVKPENCEFCKRDARLHGHHEDYTKVLEVVWLCPSCHLKLHKRNKKK